MLYDTLAGGWYNFVNKLETFIVQVYGNTVGMIGKWCLWNTPSVGPFSMSPKLCDWPQPMSNEAIH